MKLNYWMAAKAVVEFVFGIGFVLIPVKLGSIFGVELDPGGAYMAQLYGTVFIFGSILLWLTKNVSATEKPIQAIIIAVVMSNVIGFIVSLIATLSGVLNALGWFIVAVWLIFCIGFAWFLFHRKA
jgi:hypothetical protein